MVANLDRNTPLLFYPDVTPRVHISSCDMQVKDIGLEKLILASTYSTITLFIYWTCLMALEGYFTSTRFPPLIYVMIIICTTGFSLCMAFTFYNPIKSSLSEIIVTFVVVTITNIMFFWSPFDTIVLSLTFGNGALFYKFIHANVSVSRPVFNSVMCICVKEKVGLKYFDDREEEEEREEKRREGILVMSHFSGWMYE
mmetsp:Transcript_19529/g.40907  ORF Transcript_19529/g.40907 Transcript_19529/m.40907 type:complete len:198 (-) Transcript_19529:226-819(-)